MQPLLILGGAASILPGIHARYISGQEFTFIPFAWSLRIELTFYLLAFAVYWGTAARKILIPNWMRKAIPYLAIGAGYALAMAYALDGGIGPQQQTNIPWFLFGISLFLAWRTRKAAHFALLLLTTIFAIAMFPLWPQRSHTTDMGLQLLVLGSLTLSFIILSFIPRIGGRLKKVDKHLGDLAYALYINHFVVLMFLANISSQRGWGVYCLGIGVSVLVAIVMHRLVEIPLKHYRDKIRGAKL